MSSCLVEEVSCEDVQQQDVHNQNPVPSCVLCGARCERDIILGNGNRLGYGYSLATALWGDISLGYW